MPKKVKYKSSAEKQAAIAADKQWKLMAAEHGLPAKPSNKKTLTEYMRTKSYVAPKPTYRGNDTKPPSLVTTTKGGGRRVDAPKYTGTLVTGICTLHKSNAVPVINQEQATEISRMRRG